MRSQLLRLRRSNSTKGERRIGEILKNNRLKFKTKIKIGPYEIDFLVGKVVIEVDGSVHKSTNTKKDIYLFNKGFVPIHIITHDREAGKIEKDLINLIEQNNGRDR